MFRLLTGDGNIQNAALAKFPEFNPLLVSSQCNLDLLVLSHGIMK
jgi:hypothetical protein